MRQRACGLKRLVFFVQFRLITVAQIHKVYLQKNIGSIEPQMVIYLPVFGGDQETLIAFTKFKFAKFVCKKTLVELNPRGLSTYQCLATIKRLQSFSLLVNKA